MNGVLTRLERHNPELSLRTEIVLEVCARVLQRSSCPILVAAPADATL